MVVRIEVGIPSGLGVGVRSVTHREPVWSSTRVRHRSLYTFHFQHGM